MGAVVVCFSVVTQALSNSTAPRRQTSDRFAKTSSSISAQINGYRRTFTTATNSSRILLTRRLPGQLESRRFTLPRLGSMQFCDSYFAALVGIGNGVLGTKGKTLSRHGGLSQL